MPINPETSTKLNPINAHLINKLLTKGFFDNPNNNIENITPTPIPRPINDIKGKAELK